ncbi:MAG: hypothetical protein WBF73_01760 [Bradyrhizobium sp.]
MKEALWDRLIGIREEELNYGSRNASFINSDKTSGDVDADDK